MEKMPVIAIVILNWNGVSLFGQFLPSVMNNSSEHDVSVYIADNGSTDGSVEFLKKNFPGVKLIELDRNYGFAGGYNRALEAVKADIFVLLNSDVEVTANWIEPCIQRFITEPLLVAVQPKVLSYTDRRKFEYAGAAGGYVDRWGYPFCRGRVLSETEEDHGQYDQPSSVFWATGACLFIRAAAFRDAGGFDEDFFAHMEEIDLCWRLKNQGWQIGFEPGSVVYHLGGATLSYQSPQKVFLNFRNSLWMLVKNLPEGRLMPVLLPRLVLDGIAATNFLFSGQFSAIKAVFKAHVNFYKLLPRFLKKRAQLLPYVKQKKHREIFNGSMVFGYYIKKYRTFPQFNFNPDKN